MPTERVLKMSRPDNTWTVIAGPFTGDDQVQTARDAKRNIEGTFDIDNPTARYMIIVGPAGTRWHR